MREAVSLAERVSSTDANVLITGESGVGKDAVAFYIHSQSTRAAQSFVKIDCFLFRRGVKDQQHSFINAGLVSR